MEELTASEPEVTNPSTLQMECRAQLLPIGTVKPNFAGAGLAISVINSEEDLYFEFLKNFADANSAPATNRLQWIYDNHPMELVNAWGHATKSWHKHSARARGKDGKLFKFTHSGGTVTAVHIP